MDSIALVKRKLVRLVPAVLSLCSTLVAIEYLGRERYGGLAILLVAVNVLNCSFFHLSRNLIVYTESLGLTIGGIGGLWWLGVAASLITLVGSAVLGWFSVLEAMIVFAFVFNQSLYERRLEILRSGLLLTNYMKMACARPMLSLVCSAMLVWLYEGTLSPLTFFSILAISPLLACCINCSSNDAWPTWRVTGWKVTPFLLLKASMVTVAASYLFLADAALKYVSSVVLSVDSFGEYAVLSDLLTPGLWVLSSVIAWDFVPTIMRTDTAGAVRLFAHRTLLMMMLLVVLVLITVFVVPDVLWQGKYISVRSWSPLIVAVFLSVYLSSIAFPGLIVMGRLVTSVLLSLGGIATTMFVFAFWRISGLGWWLLSSPSWLLLGVNVLIVLLVVVVVFKDEIYELGSSERKVRSLC